MSQRPLGTVEKVHIISRGQTDHGKLTLYDHHFLFASDTRRPLWLCYPMLHHVERQPRYGGFSPLRIRCRDFGYMTFHFDVDDDCRRVFELMRRQTCLTSIDQLYAFQYKPRSDSAEAKCDSWKLYNPRREFERQGVGSRFKQWRISTINADYRFSPTYPGTFVVPAAVTDNVLSYAGKYRSKARIPVLSYIHERNGCTITRASQPMVGLKQARSLQDEKLVLSIFESSSQSTAVKGSSSSGHLIVDARATANAMANVALGAGSENMDHYPTARKVYLGIENIHSMRASLNQVVDALKDSDLLKSPPDRTCLANSKWLKHISNVLDGAQIVARTVHLGCSHVLVHCSDGWDRTSQLCSLANLCLDPYYRTIDGFIQLVEKDWLSFGHQFQERCGHLQSERSFVDSAKNAPPEEVVPSQSTSPGHASPTPKVATEGDDVSTVQDSTTALDSSPLRDVQAGYNRARDAFSFFGKNFGKKFGEMSRQVGSAAASAGGGNTSHLKMTSPIFHQFLDCVYQILHQHPSRFEFNEAFLKRLLYHTYSCQYGTFLLNNERERRDARLEDRTRSVWDFFLARREAYTNAEYKPQLTQDKGERRDVWLDIDVGKVRWWAYVFERKDEEMNGVPINLPLSAGGGVAQAAAHDGVVAANGSIIQAAGTDDTLSAPSASTSTQPAPDSTAGAPAAVGAADGLMNTTPDDENVVVQDTRQDAGAGQKVPIREIEVGSAVATCKIEQMQLDV